MSIRASRRDVCMPPLRLRALRRDLLVLRGAHLGRQRRFTPLEEIVAAANRLPRAVWVLEPHEGCAPAVAAREFLGVWQLLFQLLNVVVIRTLHVEGALPVFDPRFIRASLGDQVEHFLSAACVVRRPHPDEAEPRFAAERHAGLCALDGLGRHLGAAAAHGDGGGERASEASEASATTRVATSRRLRNLNFFSLPQHLR